MEMGVNDDEVERVVAQACLSYPNGPRHPKGTTYVAGRLAVPVAADGTILTVLWNGLGAR